MKYFCCDVFVLVAIFMSNSVFAEKQIEKPLPADPHFERGFRINGQKHGDPERLVDANGQVNPDAKPVWSVAQWHSKGSLDRCEAGENIVRIYDDFKSLTVDKENGSFNMTVMGGKEYADNLNADRKNPWVHLLLSQGNTMKTPLLHTLDKLIVDLEFELTEFESVLENPPKNHAAQFQLFLYLRGVDPNDTKRYNNFTWFGISMFDNRKDFTDDYVAQDFAMENGQFISTIGSKHTLKEKVEVGRRMKIKIDILPYAKTCLEKAHEKKFMKGTDFEHTLFDGMNIGWEVPGVFNCGMTVHRFVVTPIPSEGTIP